MVDFTSILTTQADAVEKPKPRPVGSYLATLVGMPGQKTVQSQGEEKPIISFSCKIIAAGADVDQDDLSAHGEVHSWPPYKKDFWVDTPEGQYALKRFLTETLGMEASGKTIAELLAESPGKQLTITLKHRPFVNRDGDAEISTEIGSTAKA
jgi:hypothetical protein